MQLNRGKVQLAMIRKGLTMKDLAARYGCTYQALQIILRGNSQTTKTLTKLCRALEVDPTEIIDL